MTGRAHEAPALENPARREFLAHLRALGGCLVAIGTGVARFGTGISLRQDRRPIALILAPVV